MLLIYLAPNSSCKTISLDFYEYVRVWFCMCSRTSEHVIQIHGDHVKPNFHWVTHIFDQILDYGPVYGFWTFVFERLNKVLKSYSTNNHAGGELETTFVREFMRNTSLRRLVSTFPTAIYLIPLYSF